MSASSSPNVVDLLTLGAAVIGPIATAWVTIWSNGRSERERIDLHLDWNWVQEGADDHFPVLHVHNKSGSTILVSEIRFLRGFFWRKPVFGTAIDFEEPDEMPLPAPVESGKIRRFRLDKRDALKHYRMLNIRAKIAGLTRRHFLWIELRTSGQSVKRIGV